MEKKKGSEESGSKDIDEESAIQDYVTELNLKRQKKLEELMKSAAVLRTKGDKLPYKPDTYIQSVNRSPLLHRSESLIRAFESERNLNPIGTSSPESTSVDEFILNYNILEVRATSVVVVLNSTAKATVWCEAVKPGEVVDTTVLRMNQKGRNIHGLILEGISHRWGN